MRTCAPAPSASSAATSADFMRASASRHCPHGDTRRPSATSSTRRLPLSQPQPTDSDPEEWSIFNRGKGSNFALLTAGLPLARREPNESTPAGERALQPRRNASTTHALPEDVERRSMTTLRRAAPTTALFAAQAFSPAPEGAVDAYPLISIVVSLGRVGLRAGRHTSAARWMLIAPIRRPDPHVDVLQPCKAVRVRARVEPT